MGHLARLTKAPIIYWKGYVVLLFPFYGVENSPSKYFTFVEGLVKQLHYRDTGPHLISLCKIDDLSPV